jgi:serine/threonine protein kinase
LIYGDEFNLFRLRDVHFGHDEYELKILMRQFQYFGPFPAKYEELADEETVAVILYLMEQIPQSELAPFHRTTEREVSPEDKEFIGKILKMDPRDRPSAKELLQDPWFEEDASP